MTLKKAYFAGGCFWGVEYHFQKMAGVKDAVSGYMGGSTDEPTYEDVCTGTTGHYEVVEVTYDPDEISYRDLARLFFEIHDPTQEDGQGPDIGAQYRSAIFYTDEEQLETVESLIMTLKLRGFDVKTRLIPAGRFWKAEEYHQDYYERRGGLPYCHVRVKRFD